MHTFYNCEHLSQGVSSSPLLYHSMYIIQMGEYLYSVNGQVVLSATHTDAARIILMGPSTASLVTFHDTSTDTEWPWALSSARLSRGAPPELGGGGSVVICCMHAQTSLYYCSLIEVCLTCIHVRHFFHIIIASSVCCTIFCIKVSVWIAAKQAHYIARVPIIPRVLMPYTMEQVW